MAEIFHAANLEVGFDPPLSGDQEPFTTYDEEDKFREKELDRLFSWACKSETNLNQLEKWMRDFMKVFIPREKKYHYHWPLWVGLNKIKERDTFLKYCRPLFWYMWN